MMREAAELEKGLKQRLKGRVLLVGAGNTLRGDDGAGPAVVSLLEGRVTASLLDAGEAPENYSGRILAEQPDTVVLIDAADFGAAPGDLAILEAEDMAKVGVSTHRIPLEVLFRYIRENSGADMFALGIQPAGIGFGESLSPAVSNSVKALAEILRRLLPA